jgi:phosphatidate cytidylyltransferase
MHLKRVIVSLVCLPLIYFYITELPPVCFLLLTAVVSALAQHEFYAMYKTPRTMSVLGIACGAILICASYLLPAAGAEGIRSLIFVAIFVSISSFRLFAVKYPAGALKDIAPVITGILYIPTLLLALWYLRLAGYEWIFLLLLCVWSSDTFAYYIGSNFGKRKLYIEVSPNKTVEGAVGSVIGGVLSAIIFGNFLIKGIDIALFVLIGAVLCAVTILGDLVESMFKRDAGIKDSGHIIPGHGGMLDRIDSILFAAPALYLLKMLL